jgi:hypothetical protein
MAEKLSDLSGNPSHHIGVLKRTLTVHGEPSLQNALEMAKSALKIVRFTYYDQLCSFILGSIIRLKRNCRRLWKVCNCARMTYHGPSSS